MTTTEQAVRAGVGRVSGDSGYALPKAMLSEGGPQDGWGWIPGGGLEMGGSWYIVSKGEGGTVSEKGPGYCACCSRSAGFSNCSPDVNGVHVGIVGVVGF